MLGSWQVDSSVESLDFGAVYLHHVIVGRQP